MFSGEALWTLLGLQPLSMWFHQRDIHSRCQGKVPYADPQASPPCSEASRQGLPLALITSWVEILMMLTAASNKLTCPHTVIFHFCGLGKQLVYRTQGTGS